MRPFLIEKERKCKIPSIWFWFVPKDSILQIRSNLIFEFNIYNPKFRNSSKFFRAYMVRSNKRACKKWPSDKNGTGVIHKWCKTIFLNFSILVVLSVIAQITLSRKRVIFDGPFYFFISNCGSQNLFWSKWNPTPE